MSAHECDGLCPRALGRGDQVSSPQGVLGAEGCEESRSSHDGLDTGKVFQLESSRNWDKEV